MPLKRKPRPSQQIECWRCGRLGHRQNFCTATVGTHGRLLDMATLPRKLCSGKMRQRIDPDIVALDLGNELQEDGITPTGETELCLDVASSSKAQACSTRTQTKHPKKYRLWRKWSRSKPYHPAQLQQWKARPRAVLQHCPANIERDMAALPETALRRRGWWPDLTDNRAKWWAELDNPFRHHSPTPVAQLHKTLETCSALSTVELEMLTPYPSPVDEFMGNWKEYRKLVVPCICWLSDWRPDVLNDEHRRSLALRATERSVAHWELGMGHIGLQLTPLTRSNRAYLVYVGIVLIPKSLIFGRPQENHPKKMYTDQSDEEDEEEALTHDGTVFQSRRLRERKKTPAGAPRRRKQTVKKKKWVQKEELENTIQQEAAAETDSLDEQLETKFSLAGDYLSCKDFHFVLPLAVVIRQKETAVVQPKALPVVCNKPPDTAQQICIAYHTLGAYSHTSTAQLQARLKRDRQKQRARQRAAKGQQRW
eukprot:TRINITY_DN67836_c7_g2_i1.p1 TRINITY_DN67836_c7_g2~~TRINITY_DN67836_c7_g2_i1.p1  ORF type:complete len:481 (+),score=15.93 TRINITY_DN67836_c7_g2_i1:59-1501(+)